MEIRKEIFKRLGRAVYQTKKLQGTLSSAQPSTQASLPCHPPWALQPPHWHIRNTLRGRQVGRPIVMQTGLLSLPSHSGWFCHITVVPIHLLEAVYMDLMFMIMSTPWHRPSVKSSSTGSVQSSLLCGHPANWVGTYLGRGEWGIEGRRG